MYRATTSFTTNDYDIRYKQILEDNFTSEEQIQEFLRIGYIEVYDGTLEITENGQYNVEDYQTADVDVPSGEPTLQSKEVTITENGTTTIKADTGYDGLSQVDVITNIQAQSEFNAKLDTTKNYGYNVGIVSIITEISEDFDTSKMKRTQNMFAYASKLEKMPVFSLEGIGYDEYAIYQMFGGCPSLTDESLNNILISCTTISDKYTGSKTLNRMGLTSAQATKCQTLPAWNDFVNAGWTTGY